MRSRLHFAWAIAPLLLLGCHWHSPDCYQKLAPAAYQTALGEAPNPYIIDVRTPKEHRKSRLAGAQNINFIGKGFRKHLQELDKDRPVFIYCETAHRSPHAARAFHKAGFPLVIDLKGGMSKWRKADLSFESPE